jgi:hypothetical protein
MDSQGGDCVDRRVPTFEARTKHRPRAAMARVESRGWQT